MLLNLVSNAIKFTELGGQINILIEYTDHSKIRVIVIDNGIGIKDSHKDKLFKLFSSFKDKKRKINVNGIGLGLVISRLIVEKFDGHINFIS